MAKISVDRTGTARGIATELAECLDYYDGAARMQLRLAAINQSEAAGKRLEAIVARLLAATGAEG